MSERVLLVILDGYGLAPAGAGNAISMAKTPNFDYYWSKYPHTKLQASGESVGLPKGQIGNSEVGHLNIGAGRIVWQDLPRITASIKDGSFFENIVINDLFKYAKENNKPLHLIGLLSDGGVHSHQKHLFALLKKARDESLTKVYIHVITDGRDVGPKSAIKYITELQHEMHKYKVGQIATIVGRYYAMDRDKRWHRTEVAYDAMTLGHGIKQPNPIKAIKASYQQGLDDEFFLPIIVERDGLISDGDAVFVYNLRSDRPRQIVEALGRPEFVGFKRKKIIKKLKMTTMTEYEKKFPATVAFSEQIVRQGLAETISEEGLTQLHLAETEKYAHVTYFFNGGRENAFKGEDRLLIPSPKVKTYDLMPEMSADKITKNLLEKIGLYDFIVVNYANSDMVGHTGNIPAAIKAVETVDRCLGKIVAKAAEAKTAVIITADHGNVESMLESDGAPKTAHTTNPVPLILIDENNSKLKETADLKLGNIAPTILDIMGVEKPLQMTEEKINK